MHENKGGYWEMRVVLMSSMKVGDCHGSNGIKEKKELGKAL